jgi:hypothetical protein
MFCQSTSYGKGCRYAPGGVHFHPDDPKHCSYCGSSNYGTGCKVNPAGKTHIHGIMFNTMFKESLINGFYMNELLKPISSLPAYKLGIINIRGERIKTPVTEQELSAYTPVMRTLIRIKRYLGPKTELLEQSTLLEKEIGVQYSSKKYVTLLEYENKFEHIFSQMHETIQEAYSNGLSFEQIEALIRK